MRTETSECLQAISQCHVVDGWPDQALTFPVVCTPTLQWQFCTDDVALTLHRLTYISLDIPWPTFKRVHTFFDGMLDSSAAVSKSCI
jgi:hypothetical protein